MSLSRTGLNWTIVAVFCGLLLLVSLVPKEDLNDYEVGPVDLSGE